jgi:hypothetical protein
MSSVWAKIQDGTVVNTQVCEADDERDPAFTWVDIQALDPRPSIGWAWDGSAFIAPPEPPRPPDNPEVP